MYEPDYSTLRDETPFSGSVSHTYLALLAVTGIPIRDYFLDAAAGIELYRRGIPLLQDMFGPDIAPPGLHTPPVSYGHVNGLGASLQFPEGGEVHCAPVADSLDEGLRLVRRKVDFASAGMAPFYLEYRRRLSEAFDGRPCRLAYKDEGPVTTTYTLRGQAMFLDPHDSPDLFREFLRATTESIVAFTGFTSRVHGAPAVNPRGGGLADDMAAMFGPDLWPAFVLPFWEQYFRGITTGRRSVHVEDLRPDHLPLLERAGVAMYDPGISARIDPRLTRERSRVPFKWRLGSFHYATLSESDIHDWVFQAAADGASSVFTCTEGIMCVPATVRKVHAFMRAAREAQTMLENKASRVDVGKCVSEKGKKRFWDRWPDSKAANHPGTEARS